jgi:DNA replication factor GINS
LDLSFRRLRSIYLSEKKSSHRLVRLEPDFYDLLAKFIAQEKENMAHAQGIEDVQAFMQFANLIKLVGDLIALRQRKIVEMAISASFSDFYEPENLVGWEKEMYNDVLSTVKRYREQALTHIGLKKAAEKTVSEGESEQPPEEEQGTVTVRILKAIPAFIGTDYNTYGPYEPGNVVSLPREVADILLVRELAEVVDNEDTDAKV